LIHEVDLPAQNNTAVIEPGSAFDAGNLATLGTAVGFSLTTGQAVARFGADPAIVLNRWGDGASVLHTFSLSALLAAPGGSGSAQLRALVQDTLDSANRLGSWRTLWRTDVCAPVLDPHCTWQCALRFNRQATFGRVSVCMNLVGLH
jgi:hypothetical protein